MNEKEFWNTGTSKKVLFWIKIFLSFMKKTLVRKNYEHKYLVSSIRAP